MKISPPWMPIQDRTSIRDTKVDSFILKQFYLITKLSKGLQGPPYVLVSQCKNVTNLPFI